MYGYGFLARQLLQKRRLVMNGVPYMVRFELLYTIRLLLGNTELYVITEPLRRPEIPSHCECVVVIFEHDMLMYGEFMWLLEVPNCMLLFLPYSVFNVDHSYLNKFNCFLWNVQGYEDVISLAPHYRVLQQFMYQNRRCLWNSGLLFGSEDDNVCCNIDLRERVNYSHCFTQAQLWFKYRKHCATRIQRAVKQWLYCPGAGLGLQIVHRLQAQFK